MTRHPTKRGLTTLGRLFVATFTLLALLVAFEASADEAATRRAAFRKAEEPLRDRDWKAAATSLRAFRQAYVGSDEAREAWVLEADALLRDGRARDALGAASDFATRHGAKSWAGRMHHVAVAALEKLGRHKEAATALRALVEDATSHKARAAIAALHTKLADRDFDGVQVTDDLGRTTTRRNVAAALTSYRRALAIGVDALEKRRIHVRVARIFEEQRQWAPAAGAWSRLLEDAGHKERPTLAELPAEEAKRVRGWLIGRGRASLRAGRRPQARGDLKEAAAWPVADGSVAEVLMLLAEERFQVAGAGPFDEGVAYLREALRTGGAPAQRKLAEAFERTGQLEKAAAEWRAYVQSFPKDVYAATARHRGAKAQFGAGRFDKAIAEWNRFLSEHPTHPLWKEVRASIVTSAFAKGAARKAANDARGAIDAWRAFAQKYEDDGRAPQALFLAASALRESKDREAALTLLAGIAGRYERTGHAPVARLMAALILEDDLGRLDDAIKAYEALIKHHGRSGQARQARARLERLKQKHLEVRMERVLALGQTPVLRVESRNIEKLKVRVYRLGLEEYFSRKGTLRGVENLQLEIVKPDWTSDWAMEGYKAHHLLAADRPVPVTERGAYVVVAGDDDLTTTTLFLISDIECIVKKSRGRQLLVWAFDRATHKPVEGARVLVAGHGEVGTTGKDGVWLGTSKKSTRARNVLVLSAQGSASTELAVGPSVNAGFRSKAYVYTDRPIYRPGAKVSWRGIYLDAQGGAYAAPSSRRGTVQVFDARGRQIASKSVTSSPFGTFSGSFSIDGLAPLGAWRVRLTVEKRGTWEGTFQVQEFRKPEFTVAVKPRKRVYLSGEKVIADLELRYSFGGVVADAPLRYQVWRLPKSYAATAAEDYAWYFRDERPRKAARAVTGQAEQIAHGELRTDAKGNAEISFQTKDRDDDAEYVVRASAMDVTRRWISDEDRIPVTRHDHMALVKTDRKAYRPKQPVIAHVRTMDARERSVARRGELVLFKLRRTVVQRPAKRRGSSRIVRDEEIEVRTFTITTDATGEAEVRLQLDEPGRYRLRWNAKSRGELVTASTDLEASGKAEDLSRDARLVAARTLYKEGESAEVLLYSPVSRGKALLTYEGEKVLDYRFVELSSGSVLLDLPLEGRHAPNVFFKVAIPGEDRLIEAQTEVVVLRHLDVSVAIEPAVALPGSEVEVTVTARDANGKPVKAELGVALVDETVFSVARDAAPPIRPYFYDKRRVLGVVGASSLGTRFYGTTRKTSKDLLADTAARTGDANQVAAQSALRLAREAIRRGDTHMAAKQVVLAMKADPQSWDARALLGSLRLSAAGDKALKRFQGPETDNDLPFEESLGAAGYEDAEMAPADGRRSGRPKSKPGRPRASSSPMSPKMDAPFEGPATASAAGAGAACGSAAGGGAGGAFRGRSGGRKGRAEKKESKASNIAVFGAAVAKESSRGFADRLQAQDAKVARLVALRAELGRRVSGNRMLKLQSKLMGLYDLGNAGAMAPLEVRKTFADTAAWEPQVVTGEDGTARFKVKLPDNLTRWRATARGVSSGALVGSGRGSVLAKRNVLVRIDPPRFLTQGDQITLASAVHNNTEDDLELTLRVGARGLDLSGEDERLSLAPGGRAVSDRVFDASSAGRATIEASIGAGLVGDAVEVSFGTLARGIKTMDARSGTSSTERGALQETFLDVPEGAIDGTTRLTVMVYPGVRDAVLDALLGLSLYPYGCVEQTVHRFLPALQAHRALQVSGSLDATRIDALRKAAERGAARLRNLQHSNGSFGWFRGGQGDLAMTAYALRGLVAARADGVAGLDRTIDMAVKAVRTLLRGGSEDARALGHLALAMNGTSEAQSYATTFRRRNEALSTAGLAWMALAARKLGRGFDTDELVRLILERRIEKEGMTHWVGRTRDCFTGSAREATALAVHALIAAGVATPHVERGMAWLLARRTRGGFGTTKATAAFVGAVAAYVAGNRPQGFGGVIEVLLDGKVVRRIETGAQPLSLEDRRFQIAEASTLAAGRHKLTFRLDGQGSMHWAVRLESVVASESLPADSHGIALQRRYLSPSEAPAPGKPPRVKPGYTILREGARPKVQVEDLEAVGSGDKVLVRLKVTAERDLEYVLVEDALPAGFEVLAGTAKGAFAWQERRDNRQVFFLTKLPRGATTLEYVLQATHLGRFTALGTTAYAMYAPETHGRGKGRSIRVLTSAAARAPDSESGLTPDEIYAVAKKRFADEVWGEARRMLTALRSDQPLRDEVVEEIETLLLRAAMAEDDHKEIVRAREELVRRNPRRIPSDLDTARAIAFAYDGIGEAEVALGLYRDLVARGFGLEIDWTNTLRARGREVEALDLLGQKLRTYPVSNATAQAAFQRARRYRELPRPKGRDGVVGRPMDEETVAALWSLTAHLAGTRLAPAVNYALLEAQSRAGDLGGAASTATAFLRRFPKSHYRDDALFFLTDVRFRRFEQAPSDESASKVREAAQPLVSEKFMTTGRRTTWSPFRERAFHVLGRVNHARGELDKAIANYKRAHGVEDAREALAFLTEERLILEETVMRPLAQGTTFPVRYRNVKEASFKAYPVDLQVLFAVRKTLEGLHRIDLSGIVPAFKWKAAFKDHGDHAEHLAQVRLPGKGAQAGVWLVIAKAGSHEASSLVIKSDLKVVLQQVGKKVRVYVTDATKGAPVRGAYVTVSDGRAIRARGLTDGRGVFEAPGVGSTPFVVVSSGDRYAIARR